MLLPSCLPSNRTGGRGILSHCLAFLLSFSSPPALSWEPRVGRVTGRLFFSSDSFFFLLYFLSISLSISLTSISRSLYRLLFFCPTRSEEVLVLLLAIYVSSGRFGPSRKLLYQSIAGLFSVPATRLPEAALVHRRLSFFVDVLMRRRSFSAPTVLRQATFLRKGKSCGSILQS